MTQPKIERTAKPLLVDHPLRDVQVLVAEPEQRHAEVLALERDQVVEHELTAQGLHERDLAVEIRHLRAERPDPHRSSRAASSGLRVVRAISSRSSFAERSPRWKLSATSPCSRSTTRSATGTTWSMLWSM